MALRGGGQEGTGGGQEITANETDTATRETQTHPGGHAVLLVARHLTGTLARVLTVDICGEGATGTGRESQTRMRGQKNSTRAVTPRARNVPRARARTEAAVEGVPLGEAHSFCGGGGHGGLHGGAAGRGQGGQAGAGAKEKPVTRQYNPTGSLQHSDPYPGPCRHACPPPPPPSRPRPPRPLHW